MMQSVLGTEDAEKVTRAKERVPGKNIRSLCSLSDFFSLSIPDAVPSAGGNERRIRETGFLLQSQG